VLEEGRLIETGEGTPQGAVTYTSSFGSPYIGSTLAPIIVPWVNSLLPNVWSWPPAWLTAYAASSSLAAVRLEKLPAVSASPLPPIAAAGRKSAHDIRLVKLVCRRRGSGWLAKGMATAHDRAGAITVIDKERAMFKCHLPTCRVITLGDDHIRFRSKREDFPSKEAQKLATVLSAHIIMQMRDVAALAGQRGHPDAAQPARCRAVEAVGRSPQGQTQRRAPDRRR
jgi:hypothetical protein